MTTIDMTRRTGRLAVAPWGAALAALVAAIGLSLGALALSGSPAPAATQPLEPDTVAVVIAGIPTQLSSAPVPVGGALAASIAFDRTGDGPGGRLLRVSLVDAQGRPLEGATIHAIGQMRYMDHGAFDVVPEPSGRGTYVARLRFPMAGEYELRLNIFGGGTTGSLLLDLDLH